MTPIGFERKDGAHWWILQDESGNTVRRSMSPIQYRILSARLLAEWLEDERRHAGYGVSDDGVARMHREAK